MKTNLLDGLTAEIQTVVDSLKIEVEITQRQLDTLRAIIKKEEALLRSMAFETRSEEKAIRLVSIISDAGHRQAGSKKVYVIAEKAFADKNGKKAILKYEGEATFNYYPGAGAVCYSISSEAMSAVIGTVFVSGNKTTKLVPHEKGYIYIDEGITVLITEIPE